MVVRQGLWLNEINSGDVPEDTEVDAVERGGRVILRLDGYDTAAWNALELGERAEVVDCTTGRTWVVEHTTCGAACVCAAAGHALEVRLTDIVQCELCDMWAHVDDMASMGTDTEPSFCVVCRDNDPEYIFWMGRRAAPRVEV